MARFRFSIQLGPYLGTQLQGMFGYGLGAGDSNHQST